MNDTFTLRVRSAAAAGWWTVLVGIAFVIAMTTGYRLMLSCRPEWVLRMCGPDITWADIQHMSLWVIVAFRFVVWLMILAAIWATLWARKLRKIALP